MKKIFLLVLIFFTNKTFAQLDSARRYIDDIFSNDSVFTVQYGSNTDYSGIKKILLADIYTPLRDTANNRAMIIILHGGGFVAGSRRDAATVFACNELAKKGYVVASIDYRIGFNQNDPRNLYSAVLRAVQDLNGFIRYAKANAQKINIDTNKIFITGSSAGGIIVLQKAFLKIDSVAASAMHVKSIKDMEGNTNNLPNTSSVAGVYSMWGVVFDTAWIQKGDVPVGCVQSIYDHIIPWNSGKFLRSDNIILYGSNSIYQRALHQQIITTLHGYASAQHDLGIKVSPYRDSTIQLMCNFFYQLIHAANQNNLKQPNDDNTFLQRIYLAKNVQQTERLLRGYKLKNKLLLLL